jgi:hypothetical protein
MPNISIVLSQEKLKDSDEAGIKNITKKTKLPIKPKLFDKLINNIRPRKPPALLRKKYSRIEQKLNNKIKELTNLIIILTIVLNGSLKKIVCKAHTIPINKTKNEPCPNKVNKKSEIFAPRGPPKLFID